MILSLKIACKFHRSYRRNIFISLVSIISIIGIIIGIAISIIILSIINGFEYELNKRILSIIPHGEIVPFHYPFINWKTILHQINTIPEVVTANPYINFTGIVEFNNKWNLVYIKSINLNKNNYYNLIDFLEDKSWQRFCTDKNQIILGKGVSDDLHVKIGDWINILFVHDTDFQTKLVSPKKINVQVSNILNLHSQFDENLAIISLSDAKNYCTNKISIDGIEIFVNNVFRINQIIKKIRDKCNENINIYSWMDNYGYIYQDIQLIRLMIYLSVLLIIGISCFNITAALILSIKNKNHDIAILRALGAFQGFIQYIFLWHGFLMYVVASILGSSIGILISLNLTNINSNHIFSMIGVNIFPKGIYFIDFIPVKFNILDTIMIISVVFLFGALTSWYTLFKTNTIHLMYKLK